MRGGQAFHQSRDPSAPEEVPGRPDDSDRGCRGGLTGLGHLVAHGAGMASKNPSRKLSGFWCGRCAHATFDAEWVASTPNGVYKSSRMLDRFTSSRRALPDARGRRLVETEEGALPVFANFPWMICPPGRSPAFDGDRRGGCGRHKRGPQE